MSRVGDPLADPEQEPERQPSGSLNRIEGIIGDRGTGRADFQEEAVQIKQPEIQLKAKQEKQQPTASLTIQSRNYTNSMLSAAAAAAGFVYQPKDDSPNLLRNSNDVEVNKQEPQPLTMVNMMPGSPERPAASVGSGGFDKGEGAAAKDSQSYLMDSQRLIESAIQEQIQTPKDNIKIYPILQTPSFAPPEVSLGSTFSQPGGGGSTNLATQKEAGGNSDESANGKIKSGEGMVAAENDTDLSQRASSVQRNGVDTQGQYLPDKNVPVINQQNPQMFGMMPPIPNLQNPMGFMPMCPPGYDMEQMQTDMLLFQIQQYKKFLMNSFQQLNSQYGRSPTSKSLLSSLNEDDEDNESAIPQESNNASMHSKGTISATIEQNSASQINVDHNFKSSLNSPSHAYFSPSTKNGETSLPEQQNQTQQQIEDDLQDKKSENQSKKDKYFELKGESKDQQTNMQNNDQQKVKEKQSPIKPYFQEVQSFLSNVFEMAIEDFQGENVELSQKQSSIKEEKKENINQIKPEKPEVKGEETQPLVRLRSACVQTDCLDEDKTVATKVEEDETAMLQFTFQKSVEKVFEERPKNESANDGNMIRLDSISKGPCNTLVQTTTNAVDSAGEDGNKSASLREIQINSELVTLVNQSILTDSVNNPFKESALADKQNKRNPPILSISQNQQQDYQQINQTINKRVDGVDDSEQLAEFILALISDENLLTMPRIRLAYDLVDLEGARRVQIDRVSSVLSTALKRGEQLHSIKLSDATLSEAITLGDFNQDQKIQFSEFCNILLKLHIVYAIQRKDMENADHVLNKEQLEGRELLKEIYQEDNVVKTSEPASSKNPEQEIKQNNEICVTLPDPVTIQKIQKCNQVFSFHFSSSKDFDIQSAFPSSSRESALSLQNSKPMQQQRSQNDIKFPTIPVLDLQPKNKGVTHQTKNKRIIVFKTLKNENNESIVVIKKTKAPSNNGQETSLAPDHQVVQVNNNAVLQPNNQSSSQKKKKRVSIISESEVNMSSFSMNEEDAWSVKRQQDSKSKAQISVTDSQNNTVQSKAIGLIRSATKKMEADGGSKSSLFGSVIQNNTTKNEPAKISSSFQMPHQNNSVKNKAIGLIRQATKFHRESDQLEEKKSSNATVVSNPGLKKQPTMKNDQVIKANENMKMLIKQKKENIHTKMQNQILSMLKKTHQETKQKQNSTLPEINNKQPDLLQPPKLQQNLIDSIITITHSHVFSSGESAGDDKDQMQWGDIDQMIHLDNQEKQDFQKQVDSISAGQTQNRNSTVTAGNVNHESLKELVSPLQNSNYVFLADSPLNDKSEKNQEKSKNNPETPQQKPKGPVNLFRVQTMVAKKKKNKLSGQQELSNAAGQSKKMSPKEEKRTFMLQSSPEDDSSDEAFKHFIRLQTMPVKSALPDKILNYDEIESCKISGMDSSPPPLSEEKLQFGEQSRIDTNIKEVIGVLTAGDINKNALLPPRIPSAKNSNKSKGSNNSKNNSRKKLNSKKEVPEVTSEQYWADCTLFSNEKRELQRIIDLNRSWNRAQAEINSNQGLQVLQDDSALLKDLDRFILRSNNQSDYIVVDKNNFEVVDVLTQERMRKLMPESLLINHQKLQTQKSFKAVKDLNYHDIMSQTSEVANLIGALDMSSKANSMAEYTQNCQELESSFLLNKFNDVMPSQNPSSHHGLSSSGLRNESVFEN